MRAVILTSDFIDSSQLKKKELQYIHKVLQQEFEGLRKRFPKKTLHFEMYRGDSFQGIILDPEIALKIAFCLKSSVKKLNLEKSNPSKAKKSMVDFRTALGIGEIDGVPKSLKAATGEAFLFSGRTLDGMKSKQQKTSLKSADKNIDHEFEVHFKFFDQLTDRWSIAAAEVVYYLLQDLKEVEIAEIIGISQSAVNSRKKASGWEAISKLLVRYETVISKKTDP